MGRLLFSLVLMGALSAGQPPAQAGTKDAPGDLVRRSYDSIMTMVASVKTRRELSEKITHILDRLVDWDAFSIKTLSAGTWEGFKPSQRKAFSSAFRGLIVRRYAKRFKPGSRFDVEVRGKTEFVGDEGAWVRTTVHTKKGKKRLGVDVDYDFRRVAAGWRTSDIVTDGVSRARSYRPKFKRILKKRGFDALVAAIKKNAKRP